MVMPAVFLLDGRTVSVTSLFQWLGGLVSRDGFCMVWYGMKNRFIIYLGIKGRYVKVE